MAVKSQNICKINTTDIIVSISMCVSKIMRVTEAFIMMLCISLSALQTSNYTGLERSSGRKKVMA